MSIRSWDTLSDEQLLEYLVFDVRKIRRRSPRNGHEIGFFIIDTPDWVNIVAFTRSRELIVVRQFRHGPAEVTVEIPGGLIDPGEDAEAAAARELREETGYEPGEIVRIGSVSPNPALFTNRCATYLATDCVPCGDPQPDLGEDLEVELIAFDDVEERVRSGDIDHALVLAALYFYRLHSDSSGAPSDARI